MMQAFRNAAKPLMVVVAITFFAWLVLDLSGITGGTGLLTQTAVGKVNGRSIDARTYQRSCSSPSTPASGRAPARWAWKTTRRSGTRSGIRSCRAACSMPSIGAGGSASARTRSSRPSGTRRRRNSEHPRIPDRQPVRPGQVPALAHLQRGPAVSARAGGQYREELQRSKLLRVVTADIYLSDAALWERYRDEHETVKIGSDRHHSPERRPRLGGQGQRRRDAKPTTRRTRTTSSGPRTAYLSYVALPRLTTASRHRGGAGAGRLGPAGDRRRRAVRRRRPPGVRRQRQRRQGR